MHRPLTNSKLLMENVFCGSHRSKELLTLCSYTRNCDGKLVGSYSQRKFLRLAWLEWYAYSNSGILLALSLSCGYNFEVCAVEPPCTRVEAETGDKALTSWWVVKLGRNQLWKLTLQICVIPLATTVAFILRVLCCFGCSCIYVQLWWNMKYVQLLCNMQLEYVTLILF